MCVCVCVFCVCVYSFPSHSPTKQKTGVPVLNDEGVLVDMYCDADVLQLPDLDLDINVGLALEQVHAFVNTHTQTHCSLYAILMWN